MGKIHGAVEKTDIRIVKRTPERLLHLVGGGGKYNRILIGRRRIHGLPYLFIRLAGIKAERFYGTAEAAAKLITPQLMGIAPAGKLRRGVIDKCHLQRILLRIPGFPEKTSQNRRFLLFRLRHLPDLDLIALLR